MYYLMPISYRKEIKKKKKKNNDKIDKQWLQV